MIINNNINAMNAHRNMANITVTQGKSMEKLSSGLRINKASDDSAGLAISENMRSQIRGLNQSYRNAQDGISMIQIAEGALSETHSIGQRMRELAVQSANGSYTDEDRKLINEEFKNLKSEIDRISEDTEFNGNKIINGNISGKEIKTCDNSKVQITGDVTDPNKISQVMKEVDPDELSKLGEGTFDLILTKNKFDVTISIVDRSHFNGGKPYVMDSVFIENPTNIEVVKLAGINLKFNNIQATSPHLTSGKEMKISFSNDAKKISNGVDFQIGANEGQMVGLNIENMRSRELGLGGIDVSTIENSKEAIERLDIAIFRVSDQRANLGAMQNRLEHTLSSVGNTAENLQAAESRIRDVDMAKEMMNLTKLNILQQASQSMLAQANQLPQQVMSILK
ncbi:flagellin [Candidatus Arthromitus sp. SFB-rat-Yit]|uniref:flagellin N-terminal helical domain-containing protein n=1 Tax=Candidatus Arthromitus sp. SFB-rat-Yit TaxID=1041504 RepID=UPI000227A6CD|nr:flagellin [Candidatus Arthromitus sp. SFB-rat-Yit]BAK81099.1 flagellin protein FliB(S) [Candidatus Arthromitus sp. SFB-rat-Yit]